MKKLITIIISIFIMLSFSITAYADNIATVSADAISLTTEEQVLIPVNLSGNKGIMGFKLTVEYPAEYVKITSVSRGELTSLGSFNTNFGINDGTFDVIWNNTSNVKDNGTLFVLSAKAEQSIKKNLEIKLSFSQPDTFNESWEDVKLNCKNIKVSAQKIETTEPTTQKNVDVITTKVPKPIDTSQIIDAVDVTLDQNNLDNLSQVVDKESFVQDFNKNLETITGTDEHNVSAFDSLESMYISAYEGKFVTEITNNIDNEKIQNIIVDTLNELGVESVGELKEKDKEKFVIAVEEKLKTEDADTPSISKDIKTDDAIAILDEFYSPSQNVTSSEAKTTNKYIYLAVIPIVFIMAIATAVLIKKRKNM